MVQKYKRDGSRGSRGEWRKVCAMPCHVPYQAMEMKMEMKTVSSGMRDTVGSVKKNRLGERKFAECGLLRGRKSKGERFSVCLVFSLMSFSFFFVPPPT